MALEFLHRAIPNTGENAGDVILFPGAWNPPTTAHVEIARAARAQTGEVIWVIPRSFPHKGFEGAGFDERCRMIRTLACQETGFSAAIADKGLYAEIAAEAAESLGPDTRIRFVLGRDAAERIAGWDYGKPGVFDRFVEHYGLLVAARDGEYHPTSSHRKFISLLPMKSSWNEVSSTEIRRRIRHGENWSDLAPPGIESIIREVYSNI